MFRKFLFTLLSLLLLSFLFAVIIIPDFKFFNIDINDESSSASVTSSSSSQVSSQSSSQISSQISSQVSSQISSQISSQVSSQISSQASSQVSIDTKIPSNMPLLVNVDNPIVPENFIPDLTDLGYGHFLEKNTAKAYYQMINFANKSGISLWCASGYRSYDLQKKLWDKRYAINLKDYGDENTAYIKTLAWTAYPGRSEHQTGLCIDFNMVDTSFKDTKEGKWLFDNADDFGFILRYPEGKKDITKTSYEPWHYRYVGIEHAKAIKESGLCLEEYIENQK